MSNTHPKPFSADQFTPTEFNSAQDKADFGNNLVAFILGGFKWDDFTEAVYKRLSNCFSHIAHYDRRGFYQNWFGHPNNVHDWIVHVAAYGPVGSPAYTFSDFERKFQSWIIRNRDVIGDKISQMRAVADALSENAGNEVRFKIIAVSKNCGGFGHKSHVMIGENGVAARGERQPSAYNPTLTDLTEGDILTFKVDTRGFPVAWSNQGFEFMDTMPSVPAAVMAEAWPEKASA